MCSFFFLFVPNGVVLTFLIGIWEMPVMNLSLVILIEVFCDFPDSLQTYGKKYGNATPVQSSYRPQEFQEVEAPRF